MFLIVSYRRPTDRRHRCFEFRVLHRLCVAESAFVQLIQICDPFRPRRYRRRLEMCRAEAISWLIVFVNENYEVVTFDDYWHSYDNVNIRCVSVKKKT